MNIFRTRQTCPIVLKLIEIQKKKKTIFINASIYYIVLHDQKSLESWIRRHRDKLSI